ncbi:hypothetical protein ONZ45_g6924 [Pleurotus djamor]|nr:hypothetical protein ONZ45_g6924 [Pleurotus djamor]
MPANEERPLHSVTAASDEDQAARVMTAPLAVHQARVMTTPLTENARVMDVFAADADNAESTGEEQVARVMTAPLVVQQARVMTTPLIEEQQPDEARVMNVPADTDTNAADVPVARVMTTPVAAHQARVMIAPVAEDTQEEQDDARVMKATLVNEGTPSPSPMAPQNNLVPPTGTRYYRFERYSVITNRNLDNRSTVTWTVDAYVYLANAPPSPTFTADGGEVFVVLVHSGSATMNQRDVGTIFNKFTVQTYPPPKGAVVETHEPLIRDFFYERNHPIDFSHEINLFQPSNPTKPTPFKASYTSVLDTEHSLFLSHLIKPSGVQWSVDWRLGRYGAPIAGVTLFKFSEMGVVNFDFRASIVRDGSGLVYDEELKTISVDCRF